MPALLVREHIESRKNWGQYVALITGLRRKDAERNQAAIDVLRARLAKRR